MIGITTIPFIGTTNIDKVKKASKLDIDFLEWICEFPHCYPAHISEKARFRLKKISRESNLKYSVHSTYVELNIAHLNPGLQEESVRQVKECIKFAGDIGAERVITHAGSIPLIPRSVSKNTIRRFGIKDVRKMFLDISRTRLSELREYADERGVLLCVENMHFDHELCNSSKEDLCILEDNFAVFDMGHANIVEDPLKFAEKILHRIRYVHVHDNNGKEDEHLPLGEGNIDYEAIIDLIGDNYYSYEPRITEINSVKETIATLRRSLK
ncbi:MAG: sugar phosphate isomerase/epimerase family protein [Halobacteriota archaeon]|nr:sugar phosphate isomerase/epimerase family protein [Halobacteriota archaeon]